MESFWILLWVLKLVIQNTLMCRWTDIFSTVMASGGTFLEAAQEWSFLLWVSGFKPPGLIHLSVGDLPQLQSSFKSYCIKSKLWISAEEAGKWSILLILGDRSAVAVCKKTYSEHIALTASALQNFYVKHYFVLKLPLIWPE